MPFGAFTLKMNYNANFFWVLQPFLHPKRATICGLPAVITVIALCWGSQLSETVFDRRNGHVIIVIQTAFDHKFQR